MNKTKIINIIEDLVEYQQKNHGIPLDSDSRLLEEAEKAVEHLRYLNKKKVSIKVPAKHIHLLLTRDERESLIKMLKEK